MAFKAGTTGKYGLIQIPGGRCNGSLIGRRATVDVINFCVLASRCTCLG